MKPKLYELTPEHREKLSGWRDRWIKNAMSVAPMTEDDREVCRRAVLGMYAAAKLPPPRHIVFVPSPFVLQIAGGFAAAIWHLHHHGPVGGKATRQATQQATRQATDQATRQATELATEQATRQATWQATQQATHQATRQATESGLSPEWYSPWLAETVVRLSRELGGENAEFLRSCAATAQNMWNGGNQWSAWPAWLSFFRHVARLGETHGIDYTAWDHYEVLAERSGPRIMHHDFCMISDRPEVLTVDDQNRPHAEAGPFCRWRDGTALYSVHGVNVPWWVLDRPEEVTVERIHAETNEEIRRVMIERYGTTRYVRDAEFEILDQDVDTVGNSRRLLRRNDFMVVELYNSTPESLPQARALGNDLIEPYTPPKPAYRIYHVPVHPELRPLLPDGGLGEPQALTALNATASSYGLRGEEYCLEIET